MELMSMKSHTINRIIRITIGIFIIPAVILSSIIITEYFARQEEALRTEMDLELSTLESNFKKNYKLVEGLNLIIKNDIELLDFLTSHEEKSNRDYIDFISGKKIEYRRLKVMFQNIIDFKIYTGNKHVLPILPFINKLQYNFPLEERMEFRKIEDEITLNIFREIFFHPENIYLDVKVNVNRLLGVENFEKLSIVNNNGIYGSDFKKSKELSKILNVDILDKNGGILEKENYIYKYTYLYNIESFLIIEKDLKGIKKNKNVFLFSTIFILSIMLFAIFFLLKYLMYRLLKQLDAVISTVKYIEKGNFDVTVPITDDKSEFNILANQINSMSSKISELIDEVVEKETSVLEAQLRAFQAQINAHFLQNTLEAIKMMAFLDGNHDISTAIINLGYLLRYSMTWNAPGVELKDEIEYIRKYIDLYTMRIDNEIDLQVEIEEGLENFHIPKMCIQPIVENSLEHGILPKDTDGTIKIKAIKEQNSIIITVYDDGMGFDRSKKSTDIEKSKSIGLKNIETRLKLFFNNNGKIEVESVKGEYTLVKLMIMAGD